ncbi:protein archease [candidate division KSB3 bacterium]|uniref:Protein archease n=1 Tax=candidate division KSB3 bacterium TaxID=2044937 RepID=A0A2G6KGZ4_9BACT|nr:MAG: protein archease [candidate division KSB3 bacterium]
MIPYHEIEHTADVGVDVYGSSFEELLQHAGYALFDTIVDASTIQPAIERTVRISGTDEESLLMNWLRELLYLFSVEQEVYTEFVIQSSHAFQVTAVLKGEALDCERHRFETELKAVTYHQFSVVKEGEQWKARVIFDV